MIATTEHDPFEVAELVEEEQRVVAGAFKVAVVGGALLLTVGLTDRTVPVQDELGALAVAVGLVDPLAGEIDQMLEVLRGAEGLGLEACHLPGGGGRLILGRTTDHDPQGGIEAEALGIIDIFIAGQTAVERWAKESQQAVLSVLPRAGVKQVAGGCWSIPGRCRVHDRRGVRRHW